MIWTRTKLANPVVTIAALGFPHSVIAATTLGPSDWTNLTSTTTKNWTDGANWSTSPDYPSGEGAVATITIPSGTTNTTTINVTPSPGTEPAVTIGSLTVTNNTNNTGSAGQLTINGGTTVNLHFNASGSGPVVTNVGGSSTGTAAPNTLSLRSVFDDNVSLTVDPTSSTSASGTLSWSGLITSGSGGLTRGGDGLLTLGTAAKQYTGATVFNGGRTRISTAGRPTNTSSFTINAGAQITLIDGASYTFGADANTVPLNINGSGATTGPFAIFPGAIRPDRGLSITLANITNLQSDSVIHMQSNVGTGATASPVGQITFSNTVSGVGKLIFTANNSDIEQGILILGGANNTYSGGTLVQGGIVRGTNTKAFGTGNVTVNNALSPSSIARIDIAAADTISDLASLSLAGGGTAGVADQNFAILETGVNETVASLILGGVTQASGTTYGATGSGATVINDEYFLGPGIITVTAVTTPGDFNGDGKVNAADYPTWRKSDGTNAGYAAWRENFNPNSGSSSALEQTSAVPEPATLALCGLSLALIATRRSGRNQRQD